MAITSTYFPIAEIKAHLSIEDENDNDLLEGFTCAARGFLEGWVGPLDDFEKVPPEILLAGREYVRWIYDSRDPDKPALYEPPPGVFSMIAPYRKMPEW
ncbi:MAG: head-tail connector protein [Xanthobacter sp.]